jgi:hypothetical protein
MASALGFSGPPSNRREVIRRIEAGEREDLKAISDRLRDLKKTAHVSLAADSVKALRSALALQHAIADARVDKTTLHALRQAFSYEAQRLRLLHGLPDTMPDNEIPGHVAAKPWPALTQDAGRKVG